MLGMYIVSLLRMMVLARVFFLLYTFLMLGFAPSGGAYARTIIYLCKRKK